MTAITGRRLTPERMDAPDIPRDDLDDALRFLRRINSGLGGTQAALVHLRRLTAAWPSDRTIRVLDLGTGSADIPLAIAEWARRAGRRVRIDAVDLHPVTLELAREQVSGHDEITLVRADATRLMERYEPGSFDFAHAALFLHHLSDVQVLTVLRIMDRLAQCGIIWSDLIRGAVARAGVRLLTIGVGPVVRHDAVVSVEAGFTRGEALELARRAGLEGVRFRTHLMHRFTLVSEKATEPRSDEGKDGPLRGPVSPLPDHERP